VATGQFMVALTTVRPLRPGDPPRDELTRPEDQREVVIAADYDAARRIFVAYCALPLVKAGRQRAKIVPLGGSDTWPAAWSAPLVTKATADLVSTSR